VVHARTENAIEVLVQEALAAGNTDPIFHALTRPPETEGEATNRRSSSRASPAAALYVVHVSCAESVEPLRSPREGWNVHGRRARVLLLDQTFLEAELRGCEVRLHSAAARQGEPGGALERGAHRHPLAISTDHCAYLSRGRRSREEQLLADPERRPGLENRLQMIHQFGVREAVSR